MSFLKYLILCLTLVVNLSFNDLKAQQHQIDHHSDSNENLSHEESFDKEQSHDEPSHEKLSHQEHSHQANNQPPLALKKIMQQLLINIQQISEGILLDNFELIEKGAQGIAAHPQINQDSKVKLANGLGQQMGTFKQYDIQVHQAALNLEQATKSKNMTEINSQYHQLFNGCLACHTEFKDRASKILASE